LQGLKQCKTVTHIRTAHKYMEVPLSLCPTN
jgi:hypothetical protein